MFQLFLRARIHQYFGGRVTNPNFRARAPGRDAETDRSRVESILLAVETSLTAAEAEQSGLTRRVEDVQARAAVTIGNDSDEYLTREPLDSHHQDLFDVEISNGQRRLRELVVAISHFRFLKAAILSRFPDLKPTAGGSTRAAASVNPERSD
jgi:hypothetical protein